MNISLDLLLSELCVELESPHKKNPAFAGFELYIPGSVHSSGQILLIAKLSEALFAPKRDDQYYLCVRDRRQDESETGDFLKNIYIINKNMDQRELLNGVRYVFARLQDWVLQMQESVLANRGLQDLMNLSEPVIGNHISVQDESFNLLAATKNIGTDDETTQRLMDNGYHPEETIRRFLKYRRIEQYETADENELIISRDQVISKYDTIKKVYKHNDAFFAIVVMVCCKKNYSAAMEELYKLLIHYITYYLEKERPQFAKPRQLEFFISELIGKTILSEDEARQRANSLNLPFEGRFELNLIVFNDILNIPAPRLAHDLSLRLVNADTTVYSRDILILCRLTESGEETEHRRRQLAGLFGELNCNCGVSNEFGSLWDMAVAYGQAHAAVITGERLRLARKEDGSFRFYHYEEFYLNHLIANGIDSLPGVFTNSFAFWAINSLKLHDEKHSVNLLETLAAYLENERNATGAGERLHMHRNTVLYHIRKIEDILNVSLDDADVRMKLLIGLKAFELDRI